MTDTPAMDGKGLEPWGKSFNNAWCWRITEAGRLALPGGGR